MSQHSKKSIWRTASGDKSSLSISLSLRRLLLASLVSGSAVLPAAIAWAGAGSPAPGTVIQNQATGTFSDPNLGSQNIESNIVQVTVAEVTGITVSASATQPPVEAPAGVPSAGPNQGNTNIDPDDVVYFTFDITNIGNDPTQFFIPETASATNGTFVGPIQIVSFDPDGSNETVLGAPVDVPAGGITTGAALGLPDGTVAPGGKVTVRVPIKAATGLLVGDNITAILGDTLASGRGNQAYSDGGSAQDLYTQDNQDTDPVDNPATAVTEVEAAGDPVNGDATFHRQEASAIQNAPIGPPIVILRDFGDAPDSYATTATDDAGEGVGASHVINADTYLGTPPDDETDAQAPLNGSGDGIEDDGIASFPDLFTNSFVYSIDNSDITVTNTSAQPATLHGWIDFDSDGTFEASEHTSISVPANQTTSTSPSDLVWSGTGPKTAGTTYARFRFTTDSSITASTPGGAANDGEVEDYQLTILPAPISGDAVCRTDYGLVYSTNGGSLSAVHTLSGARERLTNTAPVTIDGLSTDHVNRLVYYGEGNTLYAWSPLTNTHITIDPNFPSYIQTVLPAGFNISSGGAAFYNGSVYQGSDNNSGNLSEIFKIDFVPGSNGQTIQSVTAIGIEALVTNGDLGNNPNWGDFIIDDTGLLIANGNAADGYWSYDLNTSTFTDLTASFPTNGIQLAKDGEGNLWGVGGGDIFQVTVTGATLNEVAGTRQAMGQNSRDAAECVRGSSSIGDFVWSDLDGDGFQDSGEPGIEDVTVDLIWDLNGNGTIDANDPVLATQTTNSNGNYDFPELIFGDYIVQVTDTNNVLAGGLPTTGTDEIAVTLPVAVTDFNDADFGYQPPVFTPNLTLLKRITAINRGLAGEQLFDADYVDGAGGDDNAVNWPGGAVPATVGGGTVEGYIAGLIDNVTVEPGDEVEYTLPFLSSGDTTAGSVFVCDRIPANMTFIPDGFNASPPAGPGAGNRGILIDFNIAVSAFTNADDGDEVGSGADGVGGYYFPAGTDPSLTFPGVTLNCGPGTNTNGTIVVDLSDLPHATGEGNPVNSYGFIRFKARVD
ncbi:MAG: SdrD B-like domain-containing protein [Cyanobacteria bacterium J06598_3]